jgi:hypothetical protein
VSSIPDELEASTGCSIATEGANQGSSARRCRHSTTQDLFRCYRAAVIVRILIPLSHQHRSFQGSAGKQALAPAIRRPGKNGGYPNFASDVSCVPGCRGDSVARHSSFKTWSRLGVGDRLRGSHLDQDQVSLSSQPPVFPGLLAMSPERSYLSTEGWDRSRGSDVTQNLRYLLK